MLKLCWTLFNSPAYCFADNNVWKMIPVLHQVFFQQSFLQSDVFKITCKFTPQCNTTFRYKLQIQTTVLMSRAIHEAISSWLFQDLSIVKKNVWRFWSARHYWIAWLFARVLRDGKQIRIQFCCENFLLRHVLTLEHSHHFNFCLEFHDPSLLCSDGFTLINLKLSCCDHFIFSFSSYYYMKLYSSFFPFVAYWSVSDIYLSVSLPLCCLTR